MSETDAGERVGEMFQWSRPRWPERWCTPPHQSSTEGSGEIALLAPDGGPTDHAPLSVSVLVRTCSFTERSDFPRYHVTTHVQPPLTFALHLDSDPGAVDIVHRHAIPDWSSGDLTLHPFALQMISETFDGKRYHFTFPRLDFYGEPGDRDPWWQARPNPLWTDRPDSIPADAPYWFTIDPAAL